MRPDQRENVESWEFNRLVAILLRQFRRLLAERGADLSETEIDAIGDQAAQKSLTSARIPQIIAATADLVAESETVLARWNLSFAKALATPMDKLPVWETTAEFLEVANEKINAEVRISAGSALLLILGDRRNISYLVETVEHDLNRQGWLDVDAAIARRALLHASGVDGSAADWFSQVKAWSANTQQ